MGPSARVGGVAWLTNVNPLLAPGWVAGYVELRYRAVIVADSDELTQDLDDESAPIADIVIRLRAVSHRAIGLATFVFSLRAAGVAGDHRAGARPAGASGPACALPPRGWGRPMPGRARDAV